ncbi:LPS assembly lipoprotein LptE [Sphingoaurantiacus capsulatus]|uniref:LPS assembly lipoprotein LptE n=1 Tax=Sphingoaurantiacus capsulatus TaxID=1771310 RepID=A0ABV7XFB4_9SPHN
MITRSALLLLTLLLAGCGLQPVYQGGANSAAAQAMASIEVAPIPDRAGFLMRSALQDRLGGKVSNARYRLEVELDDDIEGFGIRGDDSITRERRTLRARYRLVSADGTRTLLDATARSDAGIDVVRSSDFSVIAAENSALERLALDLAEQIGTRLALLARTTPELQAAQPTP